MKNNKIIFHYWSEISTFLKENIKNEIAIQFINYGRLSGEFEEMGELTIDDISIYQKYIQVNFDGKINSIINDFYIDLNLERYGYKNLQKLNWDNWGRKGIEIGYNERESKTFGQWWFIGYFHNNPPDHNIIFKSDCPEIVAFFDVNPEKKDLLRTDEIFKNKINELINLGFESNLFEELTPNKWRLIVYRKPITLFKIINLAELLLFTEDVFNKICQTGINKHKYFTEFES